MTAWDWSLDGWIVLTAVLSACSCALLGNYLVLRKLSLMGDALSHAVLPGLAVAFLLTGSRGSWAMFAGAVVAGALTALLTQWITHYGKVEHGAAMGVVFSILFALGLILIRRAADRVDLDPGCVLYGNLVQVPLDALDHRVPPVVVRLAAVLLLNAAFVVLFYKELKISSFDPELATTLGIPATWMHYLLMILVAITTVANFEAVGSILVIAMLIVPGAAAHLWTDRLGSMLGVSLLIAMISGAGGHVLATFGPAWAGYEWSANPAAMMAVTAGGLFALTALIAPVHGVVPRAWNRMALRLRVLEQDLLGRLYREQELQGDAWAGTPVDTVLTWTGRSFLTRPALFRLKRHRLVRMDRDKQGNRRVTLTPEGSAAARRVVGSHRLWETYLAEHFDLSADHLHAPAERMEHYITPELEEALREQLTHPARDPHGRPIPPENASSA